MQVAIVKTTIDRATGRQIGEEIIGQEEVNEDAFYRPLVEILGNKVLEALRKNKLEHKEESEGAETISMTG